MGDVALEDFGIFLLFDENNTIVAEINTDTVDSVVSHLGCDNLSLVSRVGDTGIPVYSFTGENGREFYGAVGYSYAEKELFLEDANLSEGEYQEGMESAKENHARQEELLNVECNKGVLAAVDFTPPKASA